MNEQPVGPVDGRVVPRYAGLTTFARLPRIEDVDGCDVAVIGIPFDTGVSYRPGARFGAVVASGYQLPMRSTSPVFTCKPLGAA